MRRSVFIGLVGVFVLLVAGGSVASSAPEKIFWGRGVRAVLPANAATPQTSAAGLSWVSCPSAGNCGAVGRYTDSSGSQQGLLLTETDGKWAAGVEAVLPDHPAISIYWAGLSCASAGNCTAAGTYYDDTSHSGGILAITETDGVWGTGVQPAGPADDASPGSLSSVSCASAGNCTAVGNYGDNAGNVAGWLFTETNGVWATGVEASLPANAAATNRWLDLNSVSCPSDGNCTAVGDYTDSAGDEQPFVLDETGGNWATGVEAELPANAASKNDYGGAAFPVFLSSVSCASAGNCSAAGTYCAVGNCNTVGNAAGASTGEEGLILTESEGTWGASVEAALPANAATTSPVKYLSSISCASAGNCSAVGVYRDTSLQDQALLLTESAGSWSTGVEGLLPDSSATSAAELYSVSCPTAGNCTAAGVGSTGPLLLTEKAGVWARGIGVVLPTNAIGQASWATVSCASIASCSAVGSYDTANGRQGLLVNGPSLVSLIPNVKGMTVAAAKRSLRSHGCSVGWVRYVRSRRVKKGRVVWEAPKPGRAVKPGTKVNLAVSSG